MDVLLRNPDNVDLSHFILSYGAVRAILLMAVNIICPQLVLHDRLLAFIYSPFVGLPTISIPLTSSPAAVCEWFGLDYPHWRSNRFAGLSDLWQWLTDVAADSLAADAWKKIVRGGGGTDERAQIGGNEAGRRCCVCRVAAYVESFCR